VTTLNATQGSLLGFLHDGPQTGWDLLEAVGRGLSRFWNVTSSHVYRELKVLEARGLVEAGPPGPRERRPYTLTPAGRAAFAAWIAEEPGLEQIRIPLLVTLWFGRHVPRARLAAILEHQRVEHTGRLAAYRRLTDSGEIADPDMRAVVDFGIAYEDAFLSWLARLPDDEQT
jgi:DNA-binding PadR family transcriptional regulator